MENAELHGNLDNNAPQKSEGDPPPRKPGSKEKGRKRTKTGCLTCRKRRIKCGEERPTCQNCAKSKRQCEGYNQRVVFKDPLNSYRPSLSASLQGTFSGQSSSSNSRHGVPQQQPNVQTPLPIAPKLPGSFGPPLQTLDTAPISSLPPVTTPGAERRGYALQGRGLRNPSVGSSRPPQRAQPVDSKFDTVDRSFLPEASNQRRQQEQATHYDFNALIKQEPGSDPQTMAQRNHQDWSAGSSNASSISNHNAFHDPSMQSTAPAAYYHPFPTNTDWKPPKASPTTSSGPSFAQQVPFLQPDRDNTFAIPQQVQGSHDGFPQSYQGQPRLNTQFSKPNEWPVQQSAISASSQGYKLEDEEDPFDISDDDVPMEDHTGSANWQDDFPRGHSNNDLAMVVALQNGQDNQGLRLRSFTSFIDRPDMLATYVPSLESSPLRDSMTARIFCHFINVTGPSISMFERHPANPSLIFQGQPVPPSQQHIWTYTFPTVALRNPALLHAMLALASLHIAKLQNSPVTAAWKHYAIALRRIAKCLSSPMRRGQPATLAAAMLLAFFEVWAADHQKWINHLLGARQLVKEIDFAGMTRYIKSQKVQKRREERMRYYQAQQQGAGHNFCDDRLRYQAYVDDVDENIIGMLMGKKLRYDQFGHVVDDSLQDDGGKQYSQRDLELYETQRDLFWWYCKQDAYQGILGGGKLFMAYDLWSHCPPRAPLGRLNATYGTFDHLILLMARVVDFSAKDLKRKRLQMKANGGWRPPGSMGPNQSRGPPGPPQSFPQKPQQGMPQQGGPPQMPQMPGFTGMMPGTYEPKYPMGFSPTRSSSPQSSTSEEVDLEAQKAEAEEEWQDIRNAFSILQDHFGDDFEALGPEFSKPIQTPFGPALQYRTYGIAGIWMNFYLTLIACYRAHPSMPPAAMMAAGIAARQTGSFANELGRIAAGIAPDCVRMQEVTPSVGGALIESTMPLFVAGVQYQNAAQRSWTVNRLRDTARLTGWQTAHAIASGCEKSWVKAAEMGKGPPYTRMTEETPDRNFRNTWHDAKVDAEGRGERRFVVSVNDRAHHALGILGLEEYVDSLDLDDDNERGE